MMSNILPNTENQTVEFKTSFQKEVINTVVAFSNSNAMQISFFKDIKNSGGVNDPLNDPLNKILELLKENNSFSYDDLAQKLNISKSTIKRNIQKLKSNGLIKRVGSDKTGHWELMDRKNK